MRLASSLVEAGVSFRNYQEQPPKDIEVIVELLAAQFVRTPAACRSA
jgi:hypothetical protein